MLEAAVAAGDQDARVLWLLPFDLPRHKRVGVNVDPSNFGRRLSCDTYVADDDESSIQSYLFSWTNPVAFVARYRPRLTAVVPAREAAMAGLCEVYLLSASRSSSPEQVRSTSVRGDPWDTAKDAGLDTDRLVQVVAPTSTLVRWFEAAGRYLGELDEAEAELTRHWHEYGRTLPLSNRRRRKFWTWRAAAEAAYDRMLAASEEYRPIYEEITATIEATRRRYEELAPRMLAYFQWENRRDWYLLDASDSDAVGVSGKQRGLLVVRGDVRPDLVSDTHQPVCVGSLREVYGAAEEARFVDLRLVRWDEATVRTCDRELAALAGEISRICQGGKGGPAVSGFRSSFASYCRERFTYDPREMSDRAKLAADRRARARSRRKAATRSKSRSRFTGSWPTNPGDVGGFDVSVHT